MKDDVVHDRIEASGPPRALGQHREGLKTRISLLIVTGALAMMASCAPGDEVDGIDDLGDALGLRRTGP